MESERQQMRAGMREGGGSRLLSAMQRGIFTRGVFQKDISLWEQLFGSRQAVVTGKYIRPDLVCFGCFGDAAIMKDRGVGDRAGSVLFFFVFQTAILCPFAAALWLFFYLFLSSYLLVFIYPPCCLEDQHKSQIAKNGFQWLFSALLNPKNYQRS